jgi:hypothetical protein
VQDLRRDTSSGVKVESDPLNPNHLKGKVQCSVGAVVHVWIGAGVVACAGGDVGPDGQTDTAYQSSVPELILTDFLSIAVK